MRLFLPLPLLTFLCCTFARAGDTRFEGMISATLTQGAARPSHLQFARKGDRVRIEDITNKLEPINIVDLAANKLTIIYPHNTTFVIVDLATKPPPATPLPIPQITGTGAAMELKKSTLR